MTLHLTERAFEDINDYCSYIESDQESDLITRSFLKECNVTFQRILEMPDIGREGYFEGTRETNIPGFPLCVVYRTKRNRLEILTVFHQAQHPDKKAV